MASLGLLLGGLSGAALAFVLARGLLSVWRRRTDSARRRVAILFGIGLGGLAPGTLVALGLLYQFATDNLPQEPLWFAYSLPLTRLPAVLGGLLFATAVAVVLMSRPREETSS